MQDLWSVAGHVARQPQALSVPRDLPLQPSGSITLDICAAQSVTSKLLYQNQWYDGDAVTEVAYTFCLLGERSSDPSCQVGGVTADMEECCSRLLNVLAQSLLQSLQPCMTCQVVTAQHKLGHGIDVVGIST